MITYLPWSIRGYPNKVYQVYVEIKDSHSITQLIKVKQQLNNIKASGLYLVENNSPAIKRLGWEEMDDGLYYCYIK